jgi:membrane-bound lytic murein transglycosylase MltF
VAVLLLILVHWADLAQRYPQPSRLDRVQRLGTLRVAVPVDPGIDHAAFQDLHHLLLREFANRLDVNVSLVEVESQARMLDLLVRDESIWLCLADRCRRPCRAISMSVQAMSTVRPK